MNKTVKRLLIALFVLVCGVVGAMAWVAVSAFGGSIERTTVVLADGTEPIVDGFVNAFAVPLTTPGKVALIDCGNDPAGKVVKEALQAKQQSVAAIFITHGHGDHITGCAAFPGVPIYALATEVDAIEGRRNHHSTIAKLQPVKDVGVRVTNPLRDDDIVDVDGVAFHVFAVTGHTVGSAVYRARNTVFFGDTATGKTPARVEGPVGPFSDDAELGVRSLHALRARLQGETGITTFAFGHSGAMPADLSQL